MTRRQLWWRKDKSRRKDERIAWPECQLMLATMTLRPLDFSSLCLHYKLQGASQKILNDSICYICSIFIILTVTRTVNKGKNSNRDACVVFTVRKLIMTEKSKRLPNIFSIRSSIAQYVYIASGTLGTDEYRYLNNFFRRFSKGVTLFSQPIGLLWCVFARFRQGSSIAWFGYIASCTTQHFAKRLRNENLHQRVKIVTLDRTFKKAWSKII